RGTRFPCGAGRARCGRWRLRSGRGGRESRRPTRGAPDRSWQKTFHDCRAACGSFGSEVVSSGRFSIEFFSLAEVIEGQDCVVFVPSDVVVFLLMDAVELFFGAVCVGDKLERSHLPLLLRNETCGHGFPPPFFFGMRLAIIALF